MFSIPLVINHGCAGIDTSPQRLLNQSAWYRNGTDYKPWAVATVDKDMALIERPGLAAK